jgi:hypothetical protein
MPEVIVRKRLDRLSGDWKSCLNRWFYRNRPRIAVIAAFAAACLIGLAAASLGVRTLGVGSAEADTAAPAAQ